MTAFEEVQVIEANDDELALHMADAELPALLVALAHVTGDESLLDPALRPSGDFMAGPQGGYSEAQIDAARERCLSAIRAYRDAGSPSPERLRCIPVGNPDNRNSQRR